MSTPPSHTPGDGPAVASHLTLNDIAAPTTPAAPTVPADQPSDNGGPPAGPPNDASGHRRRRPPARVTVGIGVAVLAAAAAAAAAIGVGGTDAADTANVGLPPATATINRATLTETENVNGTLGYGDATTVSARSSAGGQSGSSVGGTLTWLPTAGTVIQRGKPLFRVDETPVPLIYGSLPLYRVLSNGAEGADVKELEQNLAALGYTGFTVDDSYTSATAGAVQRWQENLGLDQTGRIDMNQVVVAPSAVRVAELKLGVGDPASGPVLTYTGTTRVVDVALDVAQQHLVSKGIAATVTLPDGSVVDGIVDRVGTVATTSGSAGGGGSTTTINVVIKLSDQSTLGTLDAAPVTVTLVSDRRENVLTVPVGALVALAEGGYGVQVVDGVSSYYVAVKTGMFAGGRVEITGDGLAEGTVVGMPKS